MPTVAVPSRNSAAVSLVARPAALDGHGQRGADGPRDEGEAEDDEGPERALERRLERKNTRGKTSTQAMPKTKKSKYSEVRPTMTPTAISPGATLAWPPCPAAPGSGTTGA